MIYKKRLYEGKYKYYITLDHMSIKVSRREWEKNYKEVATCGEYRETYDYDCYFDFFTFILKEGIHNKSDVILFSIRK